MRGLSVWRWAGCLCLLLPALLSGAASLTNRAHLGRVVVRGERALTAPETESRTVITRINIEKSGARTVPDLLETRPGIRIERYGGEGQMAAVRIRGSSPAQVLVLMDGIPLNPSLGGGADLNSIDLADVESITIIRGGVSSRLGSGAFAGAVLIRSRRGRAGKRASGSLGLYGGSYGTIGLTGVVGLISSGGLVPTLRLSGSYKRSEGGYLFPGQSVQAASGAYQLGGAAVKHRNTGFTAGNGAMRLTWARPGEKAPLWALSLRYGMREAGVPGTIDFPTVNAAQNDSGLLVALESGRLALGLLEKDALFVRLFYQRQERRYADFSYYDTEESHVMGHPGLLFKYSGSSGGTALRLHATWEREMLESTSMGDGEPLSRDSGALQAGLTIPTGSRGRVEIDCRADLHSQFGWNLSPRLGGAVEILSEERLVLRLNTGAAYRLPSFSDLFWPSTFFAAGNPDLLPERSLGVDAGIRSSLSREVSLELSCFYTVVRDLIQWSPSAGGVWRPANIGRARLRGIEVSASLRKQIGALLLRVEGNYSLQYTTDESNGVNDGNQLARRPHEKAHLGIALTSGFGWFFKIDGNYLGFRYINAANTKYLGDYFLLNTGAGFSLKGGWYLRGSVHNILNTAYIHVREYPVPGREYRVESGWKF